MIDTTRLDQMTPEELRAKIDDCRRRILAEFGIEWPPQKKGGDHVSA